MAQPIRKIKKKEKSSIVGLDYCDDCFMFNKGICNANDIDLGSKEKVPVPNWCGNNKNYK